MSDVNWNGVRKPEQDEPEETGGHLGTIVFIVLLVLGVAAGGAYVNTLLLGDRVRAIVADQCPDPTCVVEVRAAHADCYGANVSWGAPSSLADFQTPKTAPKLGLGTVDLAAYQACVRPEKLKTLAEQEAR
jgi:hypothetical protein